MANKIPNDMNPLDTCNIGVKEEVLTPPDSPANEDIINMYQKTLSDDSDNFVIETNDNTALVNLKKTNIFIEELSDDDTSSLYLQSDDDEFGEEKDSSDELGITSENQDNAIRNLLLCTEGTPISRKLDDDYENDHGSYTLRIDHNGYKNLVDRLVTNSRNPAYDLLSDSESSSESCFQQNSDYDSEIMETCERQTRHSRTKLNFFEKERQNRKKEQNKIAALRYRMKKKQEAEVIFNEERIQTERNSKLKRRAEEIKREIQCLKSLMHEIYHCCSSEGLCHCRTHNNRRRGPNV